MYPSVRYNIFHASVFKVAIPSIQSAMPSMRVVTVNFSKHSAHFWHMDEVSLNHL